MANEKPVKKSWIVTLECVVKKSVVTDDCTEYEARNDPFGHAIQETEIDQRDYDVKKVEPND